jgi:hypothetical protein
VVGAAVDSEVEDLAAAADLAEALVEVVILAEEEPAVVGSISVNRFFLETTFLLVSEHTTKLW